MGHTVKEGVEAIQDLIKSGKWMDGTWIGRIVYELGEQGFDINTPDKNGMYQLVSVKEVDGEDISDYNLYYWCGSEYIAKVLTTGARWGRFHVRGGFPYMAAMVDGGLFPDMPLAKSVRKYKAPHLVLTALWLGRFEDWTEDRYRATSMV